MVNKRSGPLVAEAAISLHSQKGVYALLLGSGVSKAAGIPTGWDVTLDLAAKLHAALYGEKTKLPPKKALEWYQKEYSKDPDYSFFVKELGKTKAGERDLLQEYFSRDSSHPDPSYRQPTTAHRTIAKLVKQGFIRVILTTNFDRLMEQALEAEGVGDISVITQAEDIEASIPLVHASVTLIKVHGDYIRANLRNSPEALANYSSALAELLKRIFEEYGLMIAGWSASYDEALTGLLKENSNHRYPAYWIDPYDLSAKGQEVMQQRQAHFIKASAEEVFAMLHLRVEALEHLEVTNVLNQKNVVADVKRLLAQPDRYSVELTDYVEALTRNVEQKLRGKDLPFSIQEPGPEEHARLRSLFEETAGPLAAALMVIAKYATDGEHDVLIHRAFERIVAPLSNDHVSGVQARYYMPGLVLLSVTSVLLDNEQWNRFRDLMTKDFRPPGLKGVMVPLSSIVRRLTKQHVIEVGANQTHNVMGKYLERELGYLYRDPWRAWLLAEFLLDLATMRTWNELPAPAGLTSEYLYDHNATVLIVDFLKDPNIPHAELVGENFEGALRKFDTYASQLVLSFGGTGFTGGAEEIYSLNPRHKKFPVRANQV